MKAARRQVIPETAANANPAGDATVGSTAAGPHEPSTPPLPPVTAITLINRDCFIFLKLLAWSSIILLMLF